MKIQRCLDLVGNIFYAKLRDDGSSERLDGDLFAGLVPSGKTAEIAKVLSPVTPPATMVMSRKKRVCFLTWASSTALPSLRA